MLNNDEEGRRRNMCENMNIGGKRKIGEKGRWATKEGILAKMKNGEKRSIIYLFFMIK